MSRRSWPATAVIVLAWALLFLPQLFLGRVFVLGDAPNYRPFAELSRERWRTEHERTLWNPYVFMGIPGVASLADSRPQYLPDALIDLYESVRMPHACPLAGPLLAHLAGMLAIAAIARRLWNAGALAGVVAAIGWGMMPGTLIPFGYGHDAQFVSSALIPVVLLCTHLSFASNDRSRWLAALGVAGASGLQCLTGHPQIILYSGTLAITLAIVAALRAGSVSRALPAIGGLALGAGIGAAVWWPALLYSNHSFRSAGEGGLSLAETARYSLAPRDLLSLVWPQAVGFGGPAYWGGLRTTEYSPTLGITLVTLALLGVRRARDRNGSMMWWLVAVGVLAVLVSLGTHLGAIYELAHRYVPLWSRFRVPFYALVVTQLALALLAARAVAGIENGAPDESSMEVAAQPVTERGSERRGRTRAAATASARSRKSSPPKARRRLGALPGARFLALAIVALPLILGLGLATGLLTELYGAWMRSARPDLPVDHLAATARQAGADLLLRWVLAGAVFFALRLMTRKAPSARIMGFAIPLLIAIDLGSVAVPALHRASGPRAALDPPPPPATARLVAGDHTARGFSGRSLIHVAGHPTHDETYTNFWISWRARTLAGTHGTVPAIWRPVVSAQLTRSPHVLRAFGVTHYAGGADSSPDSTFYERMAPAGDEIVYRLRGALGRAYAVPLVIAFDDDADVVDIMTNPDYLPQRVAVTADRAAAGRYPGSIGCRIDWIQDQPDHLALRTTNPAPAFVVIADTWFAGWEARLDGAVVPIHRVNQLERGLVVPEGTHEIRMRYVPEGWSAGMWTTRASLLLWLIAALVLIALRRKTFNAARS